MTAFDSKHVYYNGEIIGNLTIIETPESLEPHVTWNNKATNRGIYLGFLAVVKALRKIKHVIIMARKEFAQFFDGFSKRGVLRKVGVLEDIDMTDLHIYQARKICH